MATTKHKLFIRWMNRRDMPEVLAIEQASNDEPWAEDDFLKCLRERNCIGIVVAQGENVIGFSIYELQKGLLGIIRLSVHPAHRRRGIGKMILEKLITKLSLARRNRLSTVICETELAGQLFLRKNGFKAMKMIRGHFGSRDGIMMEYEL
jgi:ribosomal-protein-alanine N-acetyltransferase